MAARTGLLALLLLPCVNAGFAGFSADGPLAGNPEANVRFSVNRTAAWVNLTVSGYREPLWRIEPLVRGWACVVRRSRRTPSHLSPPQVMDHMTRIFYVHDLLTPEECDHLLSLAHTEFAPSQVGACAPLSLSFFLLRLTPVRAQCRRTRTTRAWASCTPSATARACF
jgi:hypothetical protein